MARDREAGATRCEGMGNANMAVSPGSDLGRCTMQQPMLPQLGAAFLFSRGLKSMRDVIAGLPASKIREVANAGLGRSDVLAFWFGESDEATPSAASDAAIASLR